MILWAALAGAVGSCVRFGVDSSVQRRRNSSIPLGTIVINVTGSFLLGILTALVSHHGVSHELATVFGTGLLGGYTTFSTASVESFRLLREGRMVAAVVHWGGMLSVSLAAAGLGLWLGSR